MMGRAVLLSGGDIIMPERIEFLNSVEQSGLEQPPAGALRPETLEN